MKILFLLLLASLNIFAASEAEVVLLKGTATYDGATIGSNQILKGNGEVKVGDKSYLKLKLRDGGHTVVFAANSVGKLNLDKPSEAQTIGLMKGYARWITGSKNSAPNTGIKTKNAVMGIRGTNFMSLYNEVLGETEIWVFDGLVDFTNASNKADNKRISKNQWGGIGGRFGTKCQEVLNLPPNVVKIVDGILPVE